MLPTLDTGLPGGAVALALALTSGNLGTPTREFDRLLERDEPLEGAEIDALLEL